MSPSTQPWISVRLLRAFAAAYPAARFVEIGANDGLQADPLSRFIRSRRWRGLMVEPVPHLFERLRRNYADNALVKFENAAIGEADGSRPFYYLPEASGDDDDELPPWWDMIGSFDREHVRRLTQDIPGAEERIVREDVPCLAFDSLLRKHGMEAIDLLLIDTEGHDWEILRSVDLATLRPRLLIFEHYHLSNQDNRACESLLGGLGYELVADGLDTWSLDVRPDDELTRRWRSALGEVGRACRSKTP